VHHEGVRLAIESISVSPAQNRERGGVVPPRPVGSNAD